MRDKNKQNAANRRWYEANREKVREANRRWLEANPEKKRETDRRRYEAGAEKRRENTQRKLKQKLVEVSTVDAAWMAGLFEVKGWMSIAQCRPRFCFSSTRSAQIPDRLKAIMPGGVRSSASAGFARSYIFSMFGFDSCSHFSKAIMPHLTPDSQLRLMEFWGRFNIDDEGNTSEESR